MLQKFVHLKYFDSRRNEEQAEVAKNRVAKKALRTAKERTRTITFSGNQISNWKFINKRKTLANGAMRDQMESWETEQVEGKKRGTRMVYSFPYRPCIFIYKVSLCWSKTRQWCYASGKGWKGIKTREIHLDNFSHDEDE